LYFYPWKRCGYVLGLSQIPPTVCPYKTDTFFYLSQASRRWLEKLPPAVKKQCAP
jgi:hypothetical protein